MTDPFDSAAGVPGGATPPAAHRREPIFNVPGVVVAFIVVLWVIHLLLLLLPPEPRYAVIAHFSVVPRAYHDVFTGAVPLTSRTAWDLGPPLITFGLLHGSMLHIVFNAIWLLALGTPIARRLSVPRFLLFFFVCSILGAATYMLVHPLSDAPMVGASAGISGFMGGLARLMFAPRSYDPMRTRLASLFDRRVVIFAVLLTAMNALSAFDGFDFAGSGASIAWEAHVGGFFAGLLLYALFDDGKTRGWPPLYRVPKARV